LIAIHSKSTVRGGGDLEAGFSEKDIVFFLPYKSHTLLEGRVGKWVKYSS
jgi:hypothetical protein